MNVVGKIAPCTEDAQNKDNPSGPNNAAYVVPGEKFACIPEDASGNVESSDRSELRVRVKDQNKEK